MRKVSWVARYAGVAAMIIALSGCAYPGYASNGPYSYAFDDGLYDPYMGVGGFARDHFHGFHNFDQFGHVLHFGHVGGGFHGGFAHAGGFGGGHVGRA